MSNNVTYNIKDVTAKLGIKIANLEVELAHEQAKKEAYKNRVHELEDEKEKEGDAK